MTDTLHDLSPTELVRRLEDADPDWLRAVADELDRRVRTAPLERIMELWDLSAADIGRMFGVSRQAVGKWLKHGPPPARVDALADLADATDVLARYVKRERIPAVVRRPAPMLGGRSLLDLATAGETRAVRESVTSIFDLRRVQP